MGNANIVGRSSGDICLVKPITKDSEGVSNYFISKSTTTLLVLGWLWQVRI